MEAALLKLKESLETDFAKNDFPVSVLPDEIRYILDETAKNNYNADYLAGYIIPAIGTAIGNSCLIKIKNGYEECAITYTVVVGSSGSGKTAPGKFAPRPFIKKDSQNVKQYNEYRKAYEENQRRNKDEREDMAVPVLSKTIMSDFTIESISARHSNNPHSLWVVVDELKGFFETFTRYNKGNDQQKWLENFSQTPMITDRKEEGCTIIERPHISISGGIQEGVFQNLFSKMVDDGMMARFLIFKPATKPIIKLTDDQMSNDVFEIWERIINNIYSIQKSNEETVIFTYSAEAWTKVKEWQNNLPISENEAIAAIDSKLITYVHRLCLILHVMHGAYNCDFTTEIPGMIVDDSIKLYQYFRRNAMDMLERMDVISPLDELPDNKRNLYSMLPDTFTTDQARKISEDNDLLKHTALNNFIKNVKLFRRLKQGEYQKITINGSGKV